MRNCDKLVYRHRRGLTLIEILITAALLIIVLAITAILFQFGNRATQASEERNDALAERTLFSEKLNKAIGNSHRSGNTYFYLTQSNPNPDLAVSLITSESAEGEKGWNAETNQPVYQGYHLFYRDTGDNTIRYLYHPITPTDEARPQEETEVRDAIAGGTSQVLVNEATEFCLYSLQDGQLTFTEANPLGLRWRTGLERGNSILTEESFKLVNM